MCSDDNSRSCLQMTPLVRSLMQDAGWKPGVRRRHWSRADEFPCARALLDECYGLALEPLHRCGPLIPDNVEFTIQEDDARWPFHPADISDLQRIFNTMVCAIAYVGNGHEVLCLTSSGYVILFSIDTHGCFIAGSSLSESILRLITGMGSIPVIVSEALDPSGRWTLDSLTLREALKRSAGVRIDSPGGFDHNELRFS